MPACKAAPIALSSEHECALRAHSTPQKLAERARVVLLASDGLGIEDTAQRLGIWRKTARHWRRRWLAAEASADVAQRLSDASRRGAPATFTPEQICQIVALACESPEKLGIPISHWSQSELVRQAVSRGIVEGISHGSVGRHFTIDRLVSAIRLLVGEALAEPALLDAAPHRRSRREDAPRTRATEVAAALVAGRSGITLAQLGTELTRLGLTPARDGNQWVPSSLKALLDQARARGLLVST